MNADTHDQHEQPEKILEPEGVGLNVSKHSKPVDVPVFNCIVYVSNDAGSGVRARVANLSGIECTAASEREALGKIVPAFKKRVSELMKTGASIPWIEPPSPAAPGENERFVPVHL